MALGQIRPAIDPGHRITPFLCSLRSHTLEFLCGGGS